MNFNLTNSQKRILTYVGYPLLALVVFFGALWASFPVERVRYKLESLAEAHVDLQIESIEKGFLPGNFVIYGIVIKTRPKSADEKPAVIVVDELHADIGLLSLLGGTATLDFEAVVGGGTIEGDIAASKGGGEIEVETDQLQMDAMPGLKSLFAGLPVDGGLNASIDLELPEWRWDKATGTVAMSCPNCMVGPGKIKPNMDASRRRSRSMQAFAQSGVTLPRLNLGDARIKLVFDEEQATIETFEAVSPDGELYAEGYIDMKPEFGNSEPHFCFKFKFSDQAKQKDAKVMGMEAGMDKARRADGYIGMRMTGTMERPRRIGSRACIPGKPPGTTRGRDRGRITRPTPGERERPTITATTAAPEPAEEEEPEAPPASEDSARPLTDEELEDRENAENRAPPAIPPPRTSGPTLSADQDDVNIDPSREDQLEDDEVLEEDELLDEEEPLEGEEPLDDEEFVDEEPID